MIQQSESGWVPSTDGERSEVLAQLNRILADSHFRNSRRYPHFLRHVVEETLRGAGDQLKERNIGIIIFDRPPDYDTNSDSIVRVTAAEIRRRLAQYYDQREHAGELRIDLPSGSYTPQFSRSFSATPEKQSGSKELHGELQPAQPESTEPAKLISFERRVILLLIVGFISAGLGVLISWAVWGRTTVPALSGFWHFEGNRQSEILLCVGQVDPWVEMQALSITNSIRAVTKQERVLTLPDATAATAIASTDASVGLSPVMIGSHTATFTDLQREPTVLIGLFDNDWTQRLMEKLPYQLERPTKGDVYTIVDAKDLNLKAYQLDMSIPYTEFTQDYGIVARFISGVTNQPTIVVGGIAANGTAAAARLVTSESLFADAQKSLPPDWRKRNIEILVATQVIDGKSGPPKILGVHVW